MKAGVVEGVIYVFVCLNAPAESPDYYVCTAAEARAIVKQYVTRGIVNLADIKKIDAFGRWDKIEHALTPVEAVATTARPR